LKGRTAEPVGGGGGEANKKNLEQVQGKSQKLEAYRDYRRGLRGSRERSGCRRSIPKKEICKELYPGKANIT